MFVQLTPDKATLEDAENFKAFKVVGKLPNDARTLEGVGRLEGDHVWIDAGWLKAAGPNDAAWVAQLDNMLAYAKSKGWVDDYGAVRAHIETV